MDSTRPCKEPNWGKLGGDKCRILHIPVIHRNTQKPANKQEVGEVCEFLCGQMTPNDTIFRWEAFYESAPAAESTELLIASDDNSQVVLFLAF